jgi:N-acyl-D-aspartate/D-glutamate deacylase
MVLKSYDTLGGQTTNGVMFMAKKFRDANPKITSAVYAALAEASDFIRKEPRQSAEIYIKKTSETANFFGLTDRGRLAPGLRADVNLIDFDALTLHKPELIHDMPANGRRFVQRVEGYEATLVAGAPIFERGEHTGALPGKLVRAGRKSEASAAA